MNQDHARIVRSAAALAALAASALLIVGLFVALRTSPASGYEISIYAGAGGAFLSFAIPALALSSLSVILLAWKQGQQKGLLFCSVATAMLSEIGIVLLPVLRGYTFYGRGDPLTHVGMTVDIADSGHLGSSNFYPVLHLLAVSLSEATGLSIDQVRAVLPIATLLLFQVSVYLLVRLITSSHRAGLVGLILGFIPAYPSIITFTPSDTLFLFVPFLLFLFYRGRTPASAAGRLLFLLCLVVVPFSHPEVVIFLALFLACFGVSDHVGRRYRFARRPRTNGGASTPLLVLASSFFLWFSSFAIFVTSVTTLRASILAETIQSPLQNYQSLFSRAGLSFLDVLSLVARAEGAELILVLAGGFLFVRTVHRRRMTSDVLTFALVGIVVVPLVLLSLVTNFVLSYNRLLKYLVLVATIVIALCANDAYAAQVPSVDTESSRIAPVHRSRGTRPRGLGPLPFASGVIVLIALSTVSLYPSPIVLQPNDQATQTDLSATMWMIDHLDRNTSITDVIAVGRYAHALLGYDTSILNDPQLAQALYQPDRAPPPDFIYTHGYPPNGVYVLVDGYTKAVYCELFLTHGRFVCSDFSSLENQPGANTIYSSKGFEILYLQ